MGMIMSVVIFAGIIGSVWRWGDLLCKGRTLDRSEQQQLNQMLGR